MKKLLLIIFMFITLPCMAAPTKMDPMDYTNVYNKQLNAMQYQLDRYNGGNDIRQQTQTMLNYMYKNNWNKGDHYRQNFIYRTIDINIQNELNMLHKTKTVRITQTQVNRILQLPEQHKNSLEESLQKEIHYIYKSGNDWSDENQLLRLFIDKIITTDKNYPWIKLKVAITALEYKPLIQITTPQLYIPGMPAQQKQEQPKLRVYDCSRIPNNAMSEYVDHITECIAGPDLQVYQFEKPYQLLNPIWTNYSIIVNDKFSTTTQAEVIKAKVYYHWLYSKVGSQLSNQTQRTALYGQIITPQIEKIMDSLYNYFPKLGHGHQLEYVVAFTMLGEKYIKDGTFLTQMDRDVYICHCLYLLKVTTDRQSYYRIGKHIQKITPLIIKDGSIYQKPVVLKYVKDQLDIKDGYKR